MRLTLLVIPAIVAASCSAGTGTGSHTLTLYSGQHEQTTTAMVDAFTKATGISVRLRSGDESSLASQILQEGSGSPADVFYAENTPAMVNLDEKHVLAPLDAATLAAAPAQDSAAEHTWVGVSARVSAMIYNTNALEPGQLPTSIVDLGRPAWKGKVGIAPGETDFGPVVASVAKSVGPAEAVTWLKGLKSNAGDKDFPSNEALVSAVDRGDVQVGIIDTYYWYRAKQEQGSVNSAVAFFAPHDAGYVLNISGAAVLRSSKHQADAQRLVAFLASATAETILAHSYSFEYPLATGVAADPRLPPLAGLQPAPISVADIGDGALAVQLLQRASLA
ncbi:MAG: extracellular solute-binding protein [Acidimicrobiales bacterium]